MANNMKIKVRKPNGHIGSHEIEQLHDWLLTDEKERKEAVFNWTSGLARHIGYIIEKYYRQCKSPSDYPKYREVYSTRPFMCFSCLEEQREWQKSLKRIKKEVK